jgi:hypothetical protein
VGFTHEPCLAGLRNRACVADVRPAGLELSVATLGTATRGKVRWLNVIARRCRERPCVRRQRTPEGGHAILNTEGVRLMGVQNWAREKRLREMKCLPCQRQSSRVWERASGGE